MQKHSTTTFADEEFDSSEEQITLIDSEAKNAENQMNNQIYKRRPWFERVKKVMRIAIKETSFEYLGDKPNGKCIILCNHVGTSAPLAWELYSKLPFRFWGADEMNKSLPSLYKYQTRVFYHEKKGWNIHLARLFCLIASPLTYMLWARRLTDLLAQS